MDVIDQKEQRIVPIHLEKEMQRSFIEYAMSVIVDRALPDVRDGLKPVHRRILYAMDTLGLRPDKQYRKSATVVGECLGHYHPHGDSSVYDAMVRLAQDFNTRYPLVDGHGNFGSVDGDGAAAMRYTEAKLSRIATDMLADIDKETVDFGPNFDESTTEPKVLPSRFPNILVNGSNGIAVGMATNMPPHNIGETIDGLVALIDDPEITSESLMQYIPGPDFPTGGIIMGRAGIAQAYRTGRGRILVRGRAEIEPMPRDKSRIIITEIPYQVNKAKLVERIAELHKEKKVEGITDLRDESSRAGMRIVVELKAGVNANVVLNQLYKHTDLQTTFGIINLALTPEPGGKGMIPKVMSLREILTHYLDHQKDVVSRRTAFDLERARKRLEIIVGLLIAIDNVDEIVQLIKTSADPAEAKTRLMDRFGLTELQAQSILDMRLQRLTGLEKDKLLTEQKELREKIAWCEGILSSEEKLLQLIKQEALEVRDRFRDPRRTQIEQVTDDIDLGDIIQEEDMCVTMSHMGYIKRITPDAYASQRRGGHGKRGQKVREDDFIEHLFVTSTHSSMLYFTNRGRVFRNKCYSIPEAGSAAKGTSIVNLLQLGEGEKVTAILPILPDRTEGYIMMATKNGLMKKTALEAFENIRRTGLIALDLREDDELIAAELSSGDDEFIIASRNGRCLRFTEKEVRAMGRTAAGVRSMDLAEGDRVVDMVKVIPDGEVVTISDRGIGKRTPVEKYALKHRGGKGYMAMELRDRKEEDDTGENTEPEAESAEPEIGAQQAYLCGLKMYTGDSDLMMMRDDGMMIRFDLAAVASSGRSARGVILMRVPEGSRIAAVSLVPHQEPDPAEEEVPSAPEEND